MAKDVLITPASGLIDFKDTLGASDATIQLDDLGNLNISNPSGELSIGDGGGNLYIGDGVASVDIIFEQNGAVRALTGKTLTLGQADSFISVASPLSLTGTVSTTGLLTAAGGATVTGGSNTAGHLYAGTTTPTGTTRLNYSGYFYPTFINISASGDTANAATHYVIESNSDGFLRPKTLANVKIELIGNANTTFTGPTAARTYTLPDASVTLPANNQTMHIGTTAVAINRASASLALTGISSIDGSAATLTTARAINGVNFNGSAAISVPDLRGSNGTTTLATTGVTSGVNYLTTTNSITGAAVELSTAGSDTNIGLTITTKGTGSIILDTGTNTGDIELKPGSANFRLYDDDSSHYFRFVTGNTTANYDITLPAGAVTLTAGTSVVTTRSISTTAPLAGGGNLSANRTLSLASGYGDTQNPYGSKTANTFLAAPNGTAGVPTFRAIVAADVPTLNQSTTGSAATLTTTRTLWGQNFNGSAIVSGNLTSVGNITGSGAIALTAAGTLSLAATGVNIITASTNGAERIRVTSTGSVGIGTTNPLYGTLEVALGNTGSVAVVNNTVGGWAFRKVRSDGSNDMGLYDPTGFGVMALYTAGAERARIDGSGNVLIGTTAPVGSAQLEVHATVASGHAGTRINNLSASGYSTLWLSNNGSNDGLIRGGASASSFANQLALVGGSGVSLRFQTNNIERMSISAAGAVDIVGALSKGSGSFKIDHPLMPQTHHLVHSFIEGPQADLIYRGKVVLFAGHATVNLDQAAGMTEGTFVALNRNTQCFTSNESDWDPVRGLVDGNILHIECQNTQSTSTINWIVIGERKDQHMYDTGWTDENGKVIVEPPKSFGNIVN